MSGKVRIVDPSSGKEASVVCTENQRGLVVATHPLKSYITKVLPFFNETYGVNLNQDPGIGGTPTEVHNGTDDVLWTASTIVGTDFTFNSTDQNHTGGGSKSILSDSPALNDTFQIAKGSDLSLTGSTALSFWVYVDSGWGFLDEMQVYGWDTGAGTQVGTAVNISDYITPGNNDVWQEALIALEDMSLVGETLDALRFTMSSAFFGAPVVYFDDIQFESAGSPIVYTVEPEKSTHYFVNSIRLFLADALDSTLLNASMKNLDYTAFLGVASLPIGVTFRYFFNGKIINSFTIQNLGDALALPGVTIDAGGDGTNTWLAVDMVPTEPLFLNAYNSDKLTLTINDDLTDLLKFTAYASGKQRTETLQSISLCDNVWAGI